METTWNERFGESMPLTEYPWVIRTGLRPKQQEALPAGPRQEDADGEDKSEKQTDQKGKGDGKGKNKGKNKAAGKGKGKAGKSKGEGGWNTWRRDQGGR